jgi:hypothetical protein
VAINLPTSFIARLTKFYPNWDFWFENVPSGNPELHQMFGRVSVSDKTAAGVLVARSNLV